MTKKILISLPEDVLEEIDTLVAEKYNSRSELVREALREKCKEHHQMKLQKSYLTGSEGQSAGSDK